MRKTLGQLKKETDTYEEKEKSFSSNPIKVAIQNMFLHELSGANYKKYTVVKTAELLESTYNHIDTKYDSLLKRLVNKVKRAKNMEAALMVLNEYLFS